MLVRPNRLNARELHAALARLPAAADGDNHGKPPQPLAAGGGEGAAAHRPPLLGEASWAVQRQSSPPCINCMLCGT